MLLLPRFDHGFVRILAIASSRQRYRKRKDKILALRRDFFLKSRSLYKMIVFCLSLHLRLFRPALDGQRRGSAGEGTGNLDGKINAASMTSRNEVLHDLKEANRDNGEDNDVHPVARIPETKGGRDQRNGDETLKIRGKACVGAELDRRNGDNDRRCHKQPSKGPRNGLQYHDKEQ